MYDINGTLLQSEGYRVNIYGVPAGIDFSDYTGSIDEEHVEVSALTKLTGAFGTLQYVGGICIGGKIYCTPNSASSILVYDIAGGTTYTIPTGLRGNRFKLTGQLMYRGKLYMLHRGMNFMLEIDPETDTCRIITLDTRYATNPMGDYQDSYHYCGALSDQGFLYQPPAYQNQDVLKIDMRSFEVQKIRINQTAFSGAVRIPGENKILFLGGTTWELWDCDTDTYEDLTGMVGGCYDLVYDPRHNLMVGTTTSHVFIGISLDDYSLIQSDTVSGLATGYGISLGLDGRYWHLEGSKAYWAEYTDGAFTTGSIDSSDTFSGSTPYVAGQAIDTDGNIYGVPASGCMAKLSFSGVTTPLPDYIVASQYYGKY